MTTDTTQKPKTVIIPIAGKGTRMFPATAGINKAFLPIGKTNLILETLREAKMAGIEKFVLVTNPKMVDGQRVDEPDPEIVNFFARMQELIHDENPKFANDPVIQDMKDWLPSMEELKFIPQLSPEGLGHAVYQGMDEVEKGDPFAVILPDDYIGTGNKDVALAQMTHDYNGGNMIAAMEVSDEDIKKFGAFELKENGHEGKRMACKGMVEKSSTPPSNFAAIGRYILDYSVMDSLDKMVKDDARGAGNEIQLTDGIVKSEQDLSAYQYDGNRCDCGNELGYFDAKIDIMLNRGMGGHIIEKVEEHLKRTQAAENKFSNAITVENLKKEMSGNVTDIAAGK